MARKALVRSGNHAPSLLLGQSAERETSQRAAELRGGHIALLRVEQGNRRWLACKAAMTLAGLLCFVWVMDSKSSAPVMTSCSVRRPTLGELGMGRGRAVDCQAPQRMHGIVRQKVALVKSKAAFKECLSHFARLAAYIYPASTHDNIRFTLR